MSGGQRGLFDNHERAQLRDSIPTEEGRSLRLEMSADGTCYRVDVVRRYGGGLEVLWGACGWWGRTFVSQIENGRDFGLGQMELRRHAGKRISRIDRDNIKRMLVAHLAKVERVR